MQESGAQRAGRGAVILRLPVQHPAVGLQEKCGGGQHTTGNRENLQLQDKITGEVVMI